MLKMSFNELCREFNKHNELAKVNNNKDTKPLVGVVVFKSSNWEDDYSLESRSYVISSSANYFNSDKISNSLWSTNLDKTDRMVRLDYYLRDWEIDYCYLK